ncbi:MAG: hypothetical protein KGQ46_09680 [Hyphomicrobiales bacterium]|nr:hypothetical protein [Hyphomicrobiales bacterium]MDE2114837.1 hypothetical protein [Hyphomicrobiales bacterium]
MIGYNSGYSIQLCLGEARLLADCRSANKAEDCMLGKVAYKTSVRLASPYFCGLACSFTVEAQWTGTFIQQNARNQPIFRKAIAKICM